MLRVASDNDPEEYRQAFSSSETPLQLDALKIQTTKVHKISF